MKHYDRDGLSFSCPDGWRIEEEDSPEGWTATVQSPSTAFAVIRLDQSLPEPEQMIEAVMEAMRAEYRDLEVEPALETIAGEVAMGNDIEFLSLDVPTTCRVRSFHGLAGTVLVLCQVSDMDREENEPALRALVAGMRAEE